MIAGLAPAAMSVRKQVAHVMRKKYIWVSSGGLLDGLVRRAVVALLFLS